MLRKKSHALCANTVSPAVAAAVAAELGLSSTAVAAEVIHEVELGADYGFLLNAFRPSCYCWELLEILRKLILVGAMVVCVPGSVFQIWVAALLSLVFLAAHLRSWPYKLRADNIFKAVIEVLVLVSILVALVLKNPEGLKDEVVPKAAYDAILLAAYALVPLAFGAVAWLKTRVALSITANLDQAALESKESDTRSEVQCAYELHCSGLAEDTDRQLLLDLFTSARAQVGLERLQELAATIEGRGGGQQPSVATISGAAAAPAAAPRFNWREATQAQSDRSEFPPQAPAAAEAASLAANPGVTTTTATSSSRSQPVVGPTDGGDGSFTDPFAKFSGGFEGTYADTAIFYGGLVKLVGEPQKNVGEAVRAEHCDVRDGFGCSRAELTSGNYGVAFTPEEYRFVADPTFVEPMSCGLEWENQRPPIPGGLRRALDIRDLADPHVAVARIRQSFKQMGWPESAVTVSSYEALRLAQVELIAMRLYTGPCFILYNAALRAMGTGGTVAFGLPAHLLGTSVRGRFTTTLHAINSGVIKMSRLQPKCEVYRGMNGMKLPKSFVQPDVFGVRSGVEYGFMSATLDRTVAEKYSKGKDPNIPSLVLEMEMGMVNRGAFLGWISQYPDEKEILLPPLTGLEVSGYEEKAGGALVYRMGLNINMQSLTIEQVLALRQKQCLELANVVTRDLSSHVAIGDIPTRQTTASRQLAAIEAELDVEVFNDNAKFVEVTQALIAQLPQLGDQLAQFQPHEQHPVFALAAVPSVGAAGGGRYNSGPLVLSGSWDGTVALTGELATTTRQMSSPVLSLEVLEGYDLVAVGMQDGSVSLVPTALLRRSGNGGPPMKLEGHQGPVTALAWLPQRDWLACGSEGVLVWQLSSSAGFPNAEVRWRVAMTDGSVRGMSWVVGTGSSSDRVWLASAAVRGHATALWEVGLPEPCTQPTVILHDSSVRSGAPTSITSVISLGGFVVTGATNGTVAVWDIMAASTPVTSNCDNHTRALCALAAIGNAQFASGCADGSVKLWRLQQSCLGASETELVVLGTLDGHSTPVHALSCFFEQDWLVSGGTDGSIRLWSSSLRHVEDHCAEASGVDVVARSAASVSSTQLGDENESMQSPTRVAIGRCGGCGANNAASSTAVTCDACGELLTNSHWTDDADATCIAIEDGGTQAHNSSTRLPFVNHDVGKTLDESEVVTNKRCNGCGAENAETASVTCHACGELMV
eukprot:SAG22_NODE_329_length_12249_cov_27.341646_7_plen_1215_part_00